MVVDAAVRLEQSGCCSISDGEVTELMKIVSSPKERYQKYFTTKNMMILINVYGNVLHL